MSFTTGRQFMAEEIWRQLSEDDNSVVLIGGPSGSGKTFLAHKIAEWWSQQGFSIVLAEGDSTRLHRELFPLTYALAIPGGDWKKKISKKGRGLVTGLGATLGTVVSGAFIPQGLADGVLDILSTDDREKLPFLDECEVNIVQKLKDIAENSPVLLIADDVHWWDGKSKDLLSLIHSTRAREIVPELSRIKSIVISRDSDKEKIKNSNIDIFRDAYFSQFFLSTCSKEEFKEALFQMGLSRPIGRDTLDELYAACGGHLHVAKSIVRYIELDRLEEISSAPGLSELMRAAVTERVSVLGRSAQPILSLLAEAAVFGRRASLTEVACISNSSEVKLKTQLKRIESADIINIKDDYIEFTHHVIRDCLIEEGKEDREGLLDRYADCIRKIAPSEYILRSDLMSELGCRNAAGVYAVCACLKHHRENGEEPSPAYDVLLERICSSDLQSHYEALARSQKSFHRSAYSDGVAAIDSMPLCPDEVLLAEAAYLRALNLMELETSTGFQDALSALARWEGFEEQEFEIGVRLKLLRQQIHVLAGEIWAARDLDAEVMRELAKRANFDRDSKIKMYKLYRKSDAIFPPETSKLKLETARTFFSGGGDSVPHMMPVEHYRTEVNYAAVLLKLGEFSKSIKTLGALIEWISANKQISLPRRDVAVNNYLVAWARAGCDYGKCAKMLEETARSASASGENFLHLSNSAGVYMLADQPGEARRILDELAERAEERGIYESYLLYQLYSHDLNFEVHYGSEDRVNLISQKLSTLLDQISWPSREYILKRWELVRANMAKCNRGDLVAWDEAFLVTPRVGQAWSHLGRGVPLTELQFWSEA